MVTCLSWSPSCTFKFIRCAPYHQDHTSPSQSFSRQNLKVKANQMIAHAYARDDGQFQSLSEKEPCTCFTLQKELEPSLRSRIPANRLVLVLFCVIPNTGREPGCSGKAFSHQKLVNSGIGIPFSRLVFNASRLVLGCKNPEPTFRPKCLLL